MKQVIWVLVIGCLSAFGAMAEEMMDSKEAPKEIPEAESVTTNHSARIGGQTVRYTATAGLALQYNDEDEVIGQFGYTAYVKEGVDDVSKRPIMFAYNGGPGSASLWLHMGVLGPRRVPVDDTKVTGPAPYGAINNEYSILDVADLVMMDPVGTGYARPGGAGEGKDFWGVDQDIASVSQFIARYITDNGRWVSPKFVLGESYGGIRTGGVAYKLLTKYKMGLNGIILVSPLLDTAAARDRFAIDLPHVLYLPAFTSTAWYHDALPEKHDDLQVLLREAEDFAMNEYAPALMKGARLGAEERADVIAKLVKYTGISAEYWEHSNLRVDHFHFLQELLRDEDVAVGRVDSRFKGRSMNRVGERMSYDPFDVGVGPAFTAGFMHYYNTELGFKMDRNYNISGGVEDWDWRHQEPGRDGRTTLFANTAIDIEAAMILHPPMKVLIQQGYFDLATPYFVLDYVLNHMNLTPEQRANIEVEHYDSGHMMYVHPPSLVKYKDDLARFVTENDGIE